MSKQVTRVTVKAGGITATNTADHPVRRGDKLGIRIVRHDDGRITVAVYNRELA